MSRVARWVAGVGGVGGGPAVCLTLARWGSCRVMLTLLWTVMAKHKPWSVTVSNSPQCLCSALPNYVIQSRLNTFLKWSVPGTRCYIFSCRASTASGLWSVWLVGARHSGFAVYVTPDSAWCICTALANALSSLCHVYAFDSPHMGGLASDRTTAYSRLVDVTLLAIEEIENSSSGFD